MNPAGPSHHTKTISAVARTLCYDNSLRAHDSANILNGDSQAHLHSGLSKSD